MLTRQVRASAASALSIASALLLSACVGKPPPFPIVAVPDFPRPPEPPSFPEPVTPSGVRAEIIRWFSNAGYKPFQAAALADHARIESGYHPCVAGAAGLRYTYQWGGTRLQRLYQFAGVRRCPPLDKQLAFADNELRTNPNFACFWRTTTESTALTALRRGFGRGSC